MLFYILFINKHIETETDTYARTFTYMLIVLSRKGVSLRNTVGVDIAYFMLILIISYLKTNRIFLLGLTERVTLTIMNSSFHTKILCTKHGCILLLNS